jgi:prohibitin 1
MYVSLPSLITVAVGITLQPPCWAFAPSHRCAPHHNSPAVVTATQALSSTVQTLPISTAGISSWGAVGPAESSTRLSMVDKKNNDDENEQKEKGGAFKKTVDGFAKSPIILATSLAAALVVLAQSILIVDPGEVALTTRLGQLSQQGPGIHLIAPLVSNIHFLSTKTQLLEQKSFVPTKEGLTVELDTAILFKLDPAQALNVFSDVGAQYEAKVITPEASSTIKGLTSEYEAKALYTSGRTEIQNKLKRELEDHLNPRGILIEDVLLKAVVLPKELARSIEKKAEAEQASALMEFVLTKERQEAERKAIEAQGIADFQKIVSAGISPNLLQWKGIEATKQLAESKNAKIVIIGGGSGKNGGGLPIILGGGAGSD